MTTPPLLKAIFHVHTHWSNDGSMRPERLIQLCIDHGVDVLAVTDHNEIDGAFAVEKAAPFQVIVGEEVRTQEGGEIVGLFLRERIPKGTPARETIRRIRDQGGLVYLPHPFDDVRSKKFPGSLLEEIAPSVDIVETFNARNVKDAANIAARAYAEKHGKKTCAGADAHIPAELGRTFVHLPRFTTPAELMMSLDSVTFTTVRNPFWVHIASAWNKYAKSHPKAAA